MIIFIEESNEIECFYFQLFCPITLDLILSVQQAVDSFYVSVIRYRYGWMRRVYTCRSWSQLFLCLRQQHIHTTLTIRTFTSYAPVLMGNCSSRLHTARAQLEKKVSSADDADPWIVHIECYHYNLCPRYFQYLKRL